MEQKLCRICGELKDVINFSKNNKMVDGYRNECKFCSNKLYNNKEKRRELNLQKIVKIDGMKTCRVCENEKTIDNFHLKRGTSDGHRNECKDCVKIILKKYKEAPDYKENQKIYDKNRYNKIKDKILNRKKEYYIENRDKLLSYKKDYRDSDNFKINDKLWRYVNKEKLAQLQANYRLKYPHVIAWRSVLYSTLKRLGTQKEGHTIEMLGYSALDLKYHLEKQFVDGMTWENHGDWHIDHKKAVSTFDDSADIKIVCALENLQPLWAFDNLSKNRY